MSANLHRESSEIGTGLAGCLNPCRAHSLTTARQPAPDWAKALANELFFRSHDMAAKAKVDAAGNYVPPPDESVEFIAGIITAHAPKPKESSPDSMEDELADELRRISEVVGTEDFKLIEELLARYEARKLA